MGGIISFETSRRLLSDYGLRPAHLFVSGCRAPQCFRDERVFYNLPAAQFIEELRSMKGTPEDVLAHAELVQLLMPLLRADFQLCQTYEYIQGPPLDCPITAFGGLGDEDVNVQQLQAWREQTSGQFSLRMLPGDHFFLHNNEPALLSALSEEMYQLSERIA